jgi:pimeloyl-ACP methyl ester carboxylesterase
VDHLGLEHFHLVTTAAGGIVGLDFALEHPERVRSLVVANSMGGVQDPAYLEVQHRIRPSEIQELPIELRELGPSYRGINPEGTRRWMEIERRSRQEGSAGSAQPTRQPITYARLATMTVPALMRLLAEHIPHCRVETVAEAGHAAFWEQPDLWNRLVMESIGQW